ncbi:LOB domain-containing protein 30-like [Cryptomeria japonica]|uniref:LOB domain-containing protein 30-like n=1 Tax=Cryptomeria japonica TaxID=3369 RepID=UPI0025AC9C5A|nr:LOB domain-containing protein 30-like [Cryptomeria japonica]
MAARGGGAPCGACKFLGRKCVEGCVFAPYFQTEELGAAHFAAIHKIFGTSNFSKLLHSIPSDQERFDAVVSISYEAQARLQDPVYGCVSHISALQQQVAHLQGELAFIRGRMTTFCFPPMKRVHLSPSTRTTTITIPSFQPSK